MLVSPSNITAAKYSFLLTKGEESKKVHDMGQNYQDGKYALSVSLYVNFHGDLESKWAITGPEKKYPVEKYTNDRNYMALFFYGKWAQFDTINN